ncbi:MAG: MT-A70 family methyltransferase [Christensenellaceae bacterium]
MKVDIYKPEKRYKILYVDPPWFYRCGNRRGVAKNHYPTMTFSELAELPVPALAERDAVLFMWATYPTIEDALRLIPCGALSIRRSPFNG